MGSQNDHTAFERSIIVGVGGATATFLVFLSLAILGFELAKIVIAAGILLVPLATILTYYGSGGKTRDLKYHVNNYWNDDQQRIDEQGQESTDEKSDPNSLATIRERYANGEITDEQFEHKLERLLQTETIEDVARDRQISELA